MRVRQVTLKKEVYFKGKGIHSGKDSFVVVSPADEDFGIVFYHVDSGELIKLTPYAVKDVMLSTTLGTEKVTIATVEHILSALAGVGIDNALIIVKGDEIPILDGSAKPFVEQFLKAGLKYQDSLRKVVKIVSPIELNVGDRAIKVTPSENIFIHYLIDFPSSAIGMQEYSIDVTEKSFIEEIAPARTFATTKQVQDIRALGLARGGDHSNCILFSSNGVVNGPLRFENEPVRHKILDFIGDLLVFRYPIIGRFYISRGGHSLHISFLKYLVKNTSNWEIVSAEKVVGFYYNTPTRNAFSSKYNTL